MGIMMQMWVQACMMGMCERIKWEGGWKENLIRGKIWICEYLHHLISNPADKIQLASLLKFKKEEYLAFYSIESFLHFTRLNLNNKKLD